MTTPNKTQIISSIRENRDQIRSFGVKQIGLFGSFVRDRQTENSDIDLFVEFDPNVKTFDNFMDLAFFLEDLFGRRVELVTPASLSPYIGPKILNEVEYVSL